MTGDPTYSPSGPAMAPGRPKKRWGRWVALGCGAALLLAVCVGALLVFVLQQATAGPEKVVQDFLATAGAGDYTAAFDHFSAPLAQVQPFEQFSQSAAANSLFFQVAETTFGSRSVSGGSAQLAGTVTLQSGTTVPASFHLVKENGAWKLVSYNIGS
ncbi:MAG TPA: hypothetical protein VMT16_15155 [Thermoanaerobaculia bacterium]|nr:hypothetical protein [Thermoanaerobaculia bacterium]